MKKKETADELFELLRRPFESFELEWRVQRSGSKNGQPWAIVVPYVQRPAVVNRLNSVLGIDGWASDVRIVSPAVTPVHKKQVYNKTVDVAYPVGHVAVGVGVRIEGEWYWRWDGTGMLEPDPPHFDAASAGKGDFSNAFKRAAEQLGVGVYLRELKGPFFAIFNGEGRYQNKIEGEYRRWDPPEVKGTPSWPGELVDRTVPTGRDSAKPAPPSSPAQAEQQQQQKQEEDGIRVKDLQREVGAFMKRTGYYSYHLDAVILTHPHLKHRAETAEKLRRIGTAEDWAHVVELTERNKGRWEDAPKELAQDFPTSAERVELLRKLMQEKKAAGREVVTMNAAIATGWADGVEFWIHELGARDGQPTTA